MPRNIPMQFYVSEEEKAIIQEKMAQLGTENMSAYLRKMALDGYVVKLDLPELQEMISLLRYSSNNLNQLTKRANASGRIYETDLDDILEAMDHVWEAAAKILRALAAVK